MFTIIQGGRCVLYVYFLNDKPGRATWLAQACQSREESECSWVKYGNKYQVKIMAWHWHPGLAFHVSPALQLIAPQLRPMQQSLSFLPFSCSFSRVLSLAFLLVVLRCPMQLAQHPDTCHFSCLVVFHVPFSCL